MGKRWQDQDLEIKTPLEVIAEVRSDLKDGHVNIKSWDHNHPDRVEGRSNKQLIITGSMLLNRPEHRVTVEQAWAAIMEAMGN